MRKTLLRRFVATLALAVGIGVAGTSVAAADTAPTTAQSAPVTHTMVANDWAW